MHSIPHARKSVQWETRAESQMADEEGLCELVPARHSQFSMQDMLIQHRDAKTRAAGKHFTPAGQAGSETPAANKLAVANSRGHWERQPVGAR